MKFEIKVFIKVCITFFLFLNISMASEKIELNLQVFSTKEANKLLEKIPRVNLSYNSDPSIEIGSNRDELIVTDSFDKTISVINSIGTVVIHQSYTEKGKCYFDRSGEIYLNNYVMY